MTESDCIFCERPFKDSPYFVRDYGLVRVLMNYSQPTLGSVLIVPNDHFNAYSEMSDKVIAQYADVRKRIDKALHDAFTPETINFYELFMVEPHLHAHVVPRYKTPQAFLGKIYEDPGFGTKPKLGGEPLPQEELDAIRFHIKTYLHSLGDYTNSDWNPQDTIQATKYLKKE